MVDNFRIESANKSIVWPIWFFKPQSKRVRELMEWANTGEPLGWEVSDDLIRMAFRAGYIEASSESNWKFFLSKSRINGYL